MGNKLELCNTAIIGLDEYLELLDRVKKAEEEANKAKQHEMETQEKLNKFTKAFCSAPEMTEQIFKQISTAIDSGNFKAEVIKNMMSYEDPLNLSQKLKVGLVIEIDPTR